MRLKKLRVPVKQTETTPLDYHLLQVQSGIMRQGEPQLAG